ncbi:MAG TPA: cytochrome P450 [Propionibacteriaceae bacterium]|nr:cytochrome P450 [Propionibacteriaceae bacterium]
MPTTPEPLSWPHSHRDPSDPINPAPELARIRSAQPVFGVPRPLPTGGSLTMWLITKYADARELLSSRDTSNSLGRSQSAAAQPGFLASLDPPDHTRIRRMLTGQFSMRRLNTMRPYIEEITTQFLDQMEATGPPVDLMQAFALPLPSLVICDLLGVPFEDQAEFQRRSDTMLDVFVTPQQQAENTREMNAYMASLVNRHRQDPGDDILGMLIRDHAGELTDEELIGIGNILLVAGHETTSNTLGLGTLLLLQNPDQLALVRDDPELITGAVEEILRYLSIVHTGTPRIILKDMIIGDHLLHAGDVAMVSLPSANRDSDFIADPDVFQVTRQPQAHLTFGHGIHQCLGQQLARLELSVALPALLQRFPTLSWRCRYPISPSGEMVRSTAYGSCPYVGRPRDH